MKFLVTALTLFSLNTFAQAVYVDQSELKYCNGTKAEVLYINDNPFYQMKDKAGNILIDEIAIEEAELISKGKDSSVLVNCGEHIVSTGRLKSGATKKLEINFITVKNSQIFSLLVSKSRLHKNSIINGGPREDESNGTGIGPGTQFTDNDLNEIETVGANRQNSTILTERLYFGFITKYSIEAAK